MRRLIDVLMTILVVVLFGSLLSACNKPLETSASNNSDYDVSKLFTKDGCTVYSFSDRFQRHYYVKCGALNQGSTSSEYSCGKNCKRVEEIRTEHE